LWHLGIWRINRQSLTIYNCNLHIFSSKQNFLLYICTKYFPANWHLKIWTVCGIIHPKTNSPSFLQIFSFIIRPIAIIIGLRAFAGEADKSEMEEQKSKRLNSSWGLGWNKADDGAYE
jgi:hypothetical protein